MYGEIYTCQYRYKHVLFSYLETVYGIMKTRLDENVLDIGERK